MQDHVFSGLTSGQFIQRCHTLRKEGKLRLLKQQLRAAYCALYNTFAQDVPYTLMCRAIYYRIKTVEEGGIHHLSPELRRHALACLGRGQGFTPAEMSSMDINEKCYDENITNANKRKRSDTMSDTATESKTERATIYGMALTAFGRYCGHHGISRAGMQAVLDHHGIIMSKGSFNTSYGHGKTGCWGKVPEDVPAKVLTEIKEIAAVADKAVAEKKAAADLAKVAAAAQKRSVKKAEKKATEPEPEPAPAPAPVKKKAAKKKAAKKK